MALNVADLLRLLAPSPERWEFALRLALICALTALVVEFYQTPDPALTVYVVFFLNKPDRATSVLLNIVFLVLISIIISLTILVTMFVLDDPVWRVASMAAISFATLFLTSASKLRPVGPIIALISGMRSICWARITPVRSRRAYCSTCGCSSAFPLACPSQSTC